MLKAEAGYCYIPRMRVVETVAMVVVLVVVAVGTSVPVVVVSVVDTLVSVVVLVVAAEDSAPKLTHFLELYF